MLYWYIVIINILSSNGVLIIGLQRVIAKMEKYVWLMELPQQEEWKFVSVVSGVWYVITTGISEMPELPAGS